MTFAMPAPRIDRLLNDRDAVRAELRALAMIEDGDPDPPNLARIRKAAEAELRAINAELEDEGIFA